MKGLNVGTLFIVTYTGGTIGREGDHAILIPDIGISKVNSWFACPFWVHNITLTHERKYF